MLANIFMMSGFAITLYYIFSNVKSIENVKLFSSAEQLPHFFATVIFAIEGIGVVSSTLSMYLIVFLGVFRILKSGYDGDRR